MRILDLGTTGCQASSATILPKQLSVSLQIGSSLVLNPRRRAKPKPAIRAADHLLITIIFIILFCYLVTRFRVQLLEVVLAATIKESLKEINHILYEILSKNEEIGAYLSSSVHLGPEIILMTIYIFITFIVRSD